MSLCFLKSYTATFFALVLSLTYGTSGNAANQNSDSISLIQRVDLDDWRKIRIECNQRIAKNPKDIEALAARARLYTWVGRTDDALADCSKALSISSKYAPALYTKGAVLWSSGKPAAGKNYLTLFLSLSCDAKDTNTRLRRASAFKYFRDFGSMKREYAGLIHGTKNATSDADLFCRGLVFWEQHNFKEAETIFANLKQRHLFAPNIVARLAYCHTENGKEDLAFQEFAAIEKFAPDFPANYASWGWAFEKKRKYNEAMSYYDKALQIDRDNPYALCRRAECNLFKQQNAIALKDFNRVIQLDPENIEALMGRAKVRTELKEYTKSIEDCKRVIALNPKDSRAWEALGINDFYLGNFSKAHTDYQNAIHFNPKESTVYYNEGMLFRDEKQYSKSISMLKKAIEMEPSNAIYFCTLGCAEVRNRNYKQAVEDCTQSIKLDPDRSHPFLSRGQAYLALGKYDWAVKDLSKAIDGYEYVEGYRDRAAAYFKLNKPELARRDLEKVKQLKLAGKD